MSGRNFPPRSPFYRDADQTLTLSLLRNDRGVRRGERPGSAYAGHATRPDRTARACALGELRADAADAAPRRRYAGRHDHRPARRGAWRQIGKVRRRAVSARGR